MAAIPDYPVPTALDGSELVAGFKNGAQVAIPAALFGGAGGAGLPGLSAYQIWRQAGNTGSVADFLASLKGADASSAVADAMGTSHGLAPSQAAVAAALALKLDAIGLGIATGALFGFPAVAPTVMLGGVDQTPSLEFVKGWACQFFNLMLFQVSFTGRDKTGAGGALTVGPMPFAVDGVSRWPLMLDPSGFIAEARAFLDQDTIVFESGNAPLTSIGDTWSVRVSGIVPVLP